MHAVTTSAPAVTFEGVVKRYGASRALDGLSLSIPSGQMFGLIGPDGAGKTTALRHITAHLRAAGFLVNGVAADVVRLAPPLVVTDAQLDSFVAALPAALDAALQEADQ